VGCPSDCPSPHLQSAPRREQTPYPDQAYKRAPPYPATRASRAPRHSLLQARLFMSWRQAHRQADIRVRLRPPPRGHDAPSPLHTGSRRSRCTYRNQLPISSAAPWRMSDAPSRADWAVRQGTEKTIRARKPPKADFPRAASTDSAPGGQKDYSSRAGACWLFSALALCKSSGRPTSSQGSCIG
jgi:hypothetical protein